MTTARLRHERRMSTQPDYTSKVHNALRMCGLKPFEHSCSHVIFGSRHIARAAGRRGGAAGLCAILHDMCSYAGVGPHSRITKTSHRERLEPSQSHESSEPTEL